MVTFLSTPQFCELSAESKDNYWIVRFFPDGHRMNLRNLRPCGGFPNTPLTRELERASTKTRAAIDEYMHAQDEETRKQAFWKIKDTLRVL